MCAVKQPVHVNKGGENSGRHRRSIVKLGLSGYVKLSYGRSYILIAYSVPAKGLRIDDIYVDPRERGKGLGSALVGIAEDIARLLGIDLITTATVPQSAEEFWEKLGYKKVDSWLGLPYFVKELKQ